MHSCRMHTARSSPYGGGLCLGSGQRPPKDPLTETPWTGPSWTETTLDRDLPGHTLPWTETPPRRNMGPETETPLEGKWDQAARQEVISNRNSPVNRMTHTSENITLPLAMLPFAGGNSRFAIPFEVGDPSGKAWIHPSSTLQNR